MQPIKTKLKSISFLFFIILFSACGKEKKTTKAGVKMQEFIQEIAQYTRGYNPQFILIPQNGEELLYADLEEEKGISQTFLNSIDGWGIEELFYNGDKSVDEYRLNMCRKMVPSKVVLVADHLNADSYETDARQQCIDNGFLSFPRSTNNYDYKEIPTTVFNQNQNDVSVLSDAKNYLYLLSSSNYSSKESYLNAIKNTNFDLLILDAFFEDELLTAAEVNSLKTKIDGGKRLVVSYISIGSAEKYRYYWKKTWALHHPTWLKKRYEGYKDEFWVKFWHKDWEEIMYGNENSYFKKIINSNFDGAFLDNVEAFYTLYHKD